MGLSELMRMIIILVTFCLNKKKKVKVRLQRISLRPQRYTRQCTLSSKQKALLEFQRHASQIGLQRLLGNALQQFHKMPQVERGLYQGRRVVAFM